MLFLARTLKTATWHWIPLLCFRFLNPKGLSLRIECHLEGERAIHGDGWRTLIKPSSIIAYTFRAVAVMLFFSILADVDVKDHIAFVPIAAGVRAFPFVYVFTPIWMIISLVLGVGILLSIIHDQLDGAHKATTLSMKVIGALLFTSCLSCVRRPADVALRLR